LSKEKSFSGKYYLKILFIFQRVFFKLKHEFTAQITCHTQLQGDAQFVRTTEGIHKVGSFHLHFYGVKVESPGQTIKVEQSQSDRSKKAFHPVL